MDLTPFDHLELLGGFLILHVEVCDEPLMTNSALLVPPR